jgi:hypothetical protein
VSSITISSLVTPCAKTEGVSEPGRANERARKLRRIDFVRDQRQGATGDTAAARLLTRMRCIEDGDARTAPGEHAGSPRPGRAGADDGDISEHAAPHRHDTSLALSLISP